MTPKPKKTPKVVRNFAAGRAARGSVEKEILVGMSKELYTATSKAAAREFLTLAAWWRRAAQLAVDHGKAAERAARE